MWLWLVDGYTLCGDANVLASDDDDDGEVVDYIGTHCFISCHSRYGELGLVLCWPARPPPHSETANELIGCVLDLDGWVLVCSWISGDGV